MNSVLCPTVLRMSVWSETTGLPLQPILKLFALMCSNVCVCVQIRSLYSSRKYFSCD